MSKYITTFFSILFLISAFSVYAEDSAGISPEEYEKELLNDSENLTEELLHENLILAAEMRQAAGDLSGAEELFKKASLTIRGEKDFTSLYRAAVLNVEMAQYRVAEADLRAILMFSDDRDLRIKASLLTARMNALQGSIDEAYLILMNILQDAGTLPEEAGMWATEFYKKNKDIIDLSELELLLENKKENILNTSSDLPPIITPELVFSGSITEVLNDSVHEVDIQDAGNVSEQPKQLATVAAIQLGSFSQKENAEDLVKSIGTIGYKAVIKTKTVNNKIYFAVTVLPDDSENIQNLIIELKEKGYEGYPVY